MKSINRLSNTLTSELFIELCVILGLEVVFQCRDEGLLRAPVRWTRPGGRPLPPGSKDVQGRLEIPNIRVSSSNQKKIPNPNPNYELCQLIELFLFN